MNDQHPAELLPLYVLGLLPADEMRLVDAWLAESESARAELRTYREMMTAVTELTPPQSAPPAMLGDFKTRLAAYESKAISAPKLRSFRNQSLIGLALAAALLIVFGVFSAVLRPIGLAGLVGLIEFLVNLGLAIFWVFLMYKAYSGERYRIPELADWADSMGF